MEAANHWGNDAGAVGWRSVELLTRRRAEEGAGRREAVGESKRRRVEQRRMDAGVSMGWVMAASSSSP